MHVKTHALYMHSHIVLGFLLAFLELVKHSNVHLAGIPGNVHVYHGLIGDCTQEKFSMKPAIKYFHVKHVTPY